MAFHSASLTAAGVEPPAWAAGDAAGEAAGEATGEAAGLAAAGDAAAAAGEAAALGASVGLAGVAGAAGWHAANNVAPPANPNSRSAWRRVSASWMERFTVATSARFP
jgi:hypothetical protein